MYITNLLKFDQSYKKKQLMLFSKEWSANVLKKQSTTQPLFLPQVSILKQIFFSFPAWCQHDSWTDLLHFICLIYSYNNKILYRSLTVTFCKNQIKSLYRPQWPLWLLKTFRESVFGHKSLSYAQIVSCLKSLNKLSTILLVLIY